MQLLGGDFPRGELSGVNCPGSNYPRWELFGKELPGVGAIVLDGNFCERRAIIQKTIVWGQLSVGNFPRGSSPVPANETKTISMSWEDASPRAADARNKESIFKNCEPFTGSISEINNTQINKLI